MSIGRFDPKTGAVRLEGEATLGDDRPRHYVIEGTLDRDTLTLTYAFGEDQKGSVTLTRATA